MRCGIRVGLRGVAGGGKRGCRGGGGGEERGEGKEERRRGSVLASKRDVRVGGRERSFPRVAL